MLIQSIPAGNFG